MLLVCPHRFTDCRTAKLKESKVLPWHLVAYTLFLTKKPWSDALMEQGTSIDTYHESRCGNETPEPCEVKFKIAEMAARKHPKTSNPHTGHVNSQDSWHGN